MNEIQSWGKSFPAVLQRSDGHARIAAALGGIIVGSAFALACFEFSPPKSKLEQLFDFRTVQVVVPVAIMAVFFWGMFLCYSRWRRVRAAEQVVTSGLVESAAKYPVA
jgi:hypothetical protein